MRACVCIVSPSLPPSLNSLKSVSRSSASTLDIVVSPPPAAAPFPVRCPVYSVNATSFHSHAVRPSRPSVSSVLRRPRQRAGGRTRLSVASSFSAGESAGTRARSTRGGGGGDGGGGGGECGERKEGGRDDVSAASKGDESPTRLSTRSIAGCIAH